LESQQEESAEVHEISIFNIAQISALPVSAKETMTLT
jgi:hypothetical protein